MKRAILVTGILAATLMSGGCASIAHGRYERVAIASEPAGAEARIACENLPIASGLTPATLTIPRKADSCAIEVSLEGYETATIPMRRGISGVYWVNSGLAGALIPAAGAAASGGIGAGAAAGGLLGVSLFGVAGLIVDHMNGAMYDHEPVTVSVKLEPKR